MPRSPAICGRATLAMEVSRTSIKVASVTVGVLVALGAGETKTVSLPLSGRSFAFYSPEQNGWVVEPGSYGLRIGSSSRDIRLQGEYSVQAAARAD